ncbi:MAG: alpha/beta fold hydrolase [Pseudomonadota bacterium]|jgi:3-oxoadipate enol-lactonase|uniref:alpha/beta fold hydrolase n=1 Tax=Burkholderia sp. PAMC 28687 TaxID=1795874 RepID=UPI00078552F3|nr:alpha/beta fold hydrolase [Burkholderia sp. PAMC 28687]AMM12782.1 3-oxoadipate enol-lactonase [Burkholderia sp. PAMC 28687]MDP9156458.1 alpha/beta fold hydrolase [Pseudomonadota bacterium]
MHVTINGIDTRYVVSNEGGGPWLTLAHHLSGDLSVWDQIAGYFRDDYTVLRYDLPGHGESAAPTEPLSIEALSGHLAELLSKLGVTSTHLVGLSAGGMIAQQFAVDHADKVNTLTVAGAPIFTTSEMKPDFDKRAANVRQNGTSSIVEATVQSVLTERFRKAHPEVVEHVGEMVARTSVEGFAKVAEAIRDFDLRGRVASINAPTLVVAGEHDVDLPSAQSKVVADSIPGAKFEILDAAHLSPVEETQRFVALLETFLRENV